MTESPVRQLRLVVEAADTAEYETAVAFFRDALGLDQEGFYLSANDARVTILQAGRATLEIINPAQKAMIDEVEVGRPVAPKFRVAFQVDDAATTTDALVAAGAELLAAPTRTPWDSLNARLAAPAGVQITVFQELAEP